ncbi:MAG TPA: hypothetical protein QGI71_05270 [Dehalococcoidia bacterium]|nr:hypothetical protein [Dehalococcoidia bacterium]
MVYGDPSPFTGQTVAGKPAAAERLCVVVASASHSIDVDSSNCFALP